MTMRYQIIARQMSPPDGRYFQHIAAVKWRVDSSIGQCTRRQMVAAIDSGDTALRAGSVMRQVRLLHPHRSSISFVGVSFTRFRDHRFDGRQAVARANRPRVRRRSLRAASHAGWT
jgi:hypothetical protein